MSHEAKLAELRAKTDLELAAYITNALNLALRLASEADDRSRMRAEDSYSEIVRLLPVIYRLSQPERRRFDGKLTRLREMLDQAPALAQ
ncbi:MAG TPA: hypothetical protein VMH81_31755 [Bryobacteraceae bacterium]|nr:hypothetical protein [Bryobacteraceae bacterium]